MGAKIIAKKQQLYSYMKNLIKKSILTTMNNTDIVKIAKMAINEIKPNKYLYIIQIPKSKIYQSSSILQ